MGGLARPHRSGDTAAMRRIVGVTVIAGLLALGGGAYWYWTAIDRAIARTERFADPDDADLALLRSHAADARVLPAAAALSTRLMRRGECRQDVLDTLDVIHVAQPRTDEAGAAAAAVALLRCQHAPARAWGASSGDVIARGIRETLREKRHDDDSDPLIAWLEDSQAPVSEPVLVAVALALGTSARADAHFELGFPPDGQPLTAVSRVPVAGDARLVTPVREALLQYTHMTPTGKRVTPMLARVTRSVKVPISDEVIHAVLRLDEAGQAEVAKNLFTAADAPRIERYAREHQAWAVTSGRLARIVDALGSGSDGDAQAILDALRTTVPPQWHPGRDDPEHPRSVLAAQNALLAMGERGARVALANLQSDHLAVRMVCVEVLFALDRPRFVDAVVAAAPRLGALELHRALALAKADDPDLRLRLAALASPGMVEHVRAELLAIPADELVPRLFALLAVREAFTPEEVAAYQKLLQDSPRSAAPTAKALDDALTRAGAPERVYWLSKLLALEHLAKVGGPGERAVVVKFLADTSSYEDVVIEVDERTGVELRRSPTRILFTTLAAKALEHID